jgi:hypothetical protein
VAGDFNVGKLIDYSSTFNTIVLSELITKLRTLGFLTGRPEAVRVGNNIYATPTINTGIPQGCVLSPLLYSLFTHKCVDAHDSNTIIKFADDTWWSD